MLPSLLALISIHQAPWSFGTPDKPAPTPTPTQRALEIARVRDFVRVVEIDREGRLTSIPTENPEPVLSQRGNPLGWRSYGYRGFYVSFDPSTGLVMGFAGRANHELDRPKHDGIDEAGRQRPMRAPRKVSDDEARTLAARYYAAAGRPYDVFVSYVDDEFVFDTNLSVGFLPSYRGVPFSDDFPGHMLIDRETGELDQMRIFQEPPPPPDSVVPGISLAEARLVALGAAARAGRVVWEDPVPYDRLCIALLDREPYPYATHNFSPSDWTDARAGRSRLVYDVRVWDTQGVEYVVYVDAHDGRLLQVHSRVFAILGAPSASRTAAPVGPPSEPRPWRVAESDGPWSASVMSVLKSSPPLDGFSGKRKLILTDGCTAFQALYDPERELLGIEDAAGKVSIFRPGLALADLLRKN